MWAIPREDALKPKRVVFIEVAEVSLRHKSQESKSSLRSFACNFPPRPQIKSEVDTLPPPYRETYSFSTLKKRVVRRFQNRKAPSVIAPR